MLSADLLALHQRYCGYLGDDGIELSREGIATMAALFRDFAERAQALETQLVPAGARVVPADLAAKSGHNVIVFPGGAA